MSAAEVAAALVVHPRFLSVYSPLAPNLANPATAGTLLAHLLAAAKARHLAVVIEHDPRCAFPEVRLVGPARDLDPGPTAAFVMMPLGEAVAMALLAAWGPA